MAGKEPLVGIGDLAGRSIPHPMEESWRSDGESWRSGGSALGEWATAFVLLFLLFWQLLRAVSARRRLRPRSLQSPVGAFSTADTRPMCPVEGDSSSPPSSSGISKIISEEDLKILISNLEGTFVDVDKWEDVIDKKNDKISYNAKCCKPKDGPLRYLSVTTFEKCSVEILRDFYMDNEYRKVWDKTLVDHEQLEIDVSSGTEVGRTIKKFPLLSPREYVLAWRIWEGKNKYFYCLIKIHTKKRNRFEHKRLNDLVYIQYNWRLKERFKERRMKPEQYDPICFDDLDWSSKWMTGRSVHDDLVHDSSDLRWVDVDAILGASEILDGPNRPRRMRVRRSGTTSALCQTSTALEDDLEGNEEDIEEQEWVDAEIDTEHDDDSNEDGIDEEDDEDIDKRDTICGDPLAGASLDEDLSFGIKI